ncbi:transcription activator amyR [Fusarium heterosporum]|uniref:Transcription activator amyR n=1 Tax=Fusarium heterosporum TaxID=42747 RepID=A0A8H5T084_FUSHE|nr:transcription activator amyR [Fusarium heterosporum]
MTTAVKRACDGCHRRKVKCDGNQQCRNCENASLHCTYNAIPQKKGPKGSRAKVISELRENQRATSLSALVHSKLVLHSGPSPGGDTSLNPTPNMLSADLLKSCVNFFFDNVYPMIPILDRNEIDASMQNVDGVRDSYCLFTSLCAFVLLQPGMNMPPNDPFNLDSLPGATIAASTMLLDECLRVRKGNDFQEMINLNVLATSFFIYGTCNALEQHDRAWFYLREATTMVHMAGMTQETTFTRYPASEAVRRRRLYWLLLASERAYSVQRLYPSTLPANVAPSSMGDDANDAMYPDFHLFFLLCDLYRTVDDAFLHTWRYGCGHLDAATITNLQKQINTGANPYPTESNYSANQQWLKNNLWQFKNNNEEPYSYNSSAMVLTQKMVSAFPGNQAELMNSGLIPKLVEVTLNLINLLANKPQPRQSFDLGPRHWLKQVMDIMDAIRTNQFQFVPLLLSKVNEILPRVIRPVLDNAPENPQFKMPDMFDGFGNAGMAQMPMEDYNPPMPVGNYNQTIPMSDYDHKYQDMGGNSPDSLPNSHHSNGTPPGSQAGNEMPQSFVSSPGTVMSPSAMEYTQNISGFAIHDMMSPLGGPPQPNNMNNLQHQQSIENQPQMQSLGGLYDIRDIRQPQRQNSFHLQNQSPLNGMGQMPSDMSFQPMR